jgi:uncharacterized protein
VITINEVETLIKTKTRAKARIQRLEQRVGDSVAFLSYSIDDKNQMTIWHTEIPRSLQHIGIGRRLVEEAVQLASRDSSSLRIVCPFAKEHLARHPELIEAGAAKILVAPFLSDSRSVRSPWTSYLTGENSTQGGDL